MANNKQFIPVTFEISRITTLTPTEKLVLARIASFREYFESATACAEILGTKPDTIRKAKQKLEQEGYIECTGDHGRGKSYVSTDQWKFNSPKPRKEESKAPASHPMLKASPAVKRVKRDKDVRLEKINPDLNKVMDKSIKYLSDRGIPIVDKRALRNGLIAAYNSLVMDTPENRIKILIGYLDYIQSDHYYYQMQNNQFCPRILQQDDLFRKFANIRNYKNDFSRQYDPSKVLTK